MKKIKNNKGITLMALVITIIVLIILASVGIYSGIQVVKSAQFTAFSTELKIMQTQVNSLYEKKKNNEKILLNNVETEIEQIGTPISSDPDAQEQAYTVFTASASGITREDIPNYKYFDNTTIKNLNIEGVEGEFFVNIDKRSVVSYDGFEYEGKTYYTLEQLPDGLYNVEHNTSEQQPDFNVDYELLENGKCKIIVNNINYNGNINKWQVKYKKENEDDWKQSNNYSFMIDELGNYRVKIANNNVESNEKQIKAFGLLPSEFQEVEYIESTGTQYIDTGTEIDNGYTINTDILFTDFQNNYLITGTYGMESRVSINDNARYFIRIDKNTGNLHYQYGSSTKYGQTILQLNTKYNIECKLINNMQYLKLDNYFLFSTSINKYQPKTSLIFLGNIDNNNDGISIRNICHAKAYNCKYYDSNDKLIRDFIPCYSTTTVTDVDGEPCSAGTIGLYDTANNQFYVNKGSGTFLKGNDIDSGDTINNIIINDI